MTYGNPMITRQRRHLSSLCSGVTLRVNIIRPQSSTTRGAGYPRFQGSIDAQLFFFPPSEIHRDMCAKVPKMAYHSPFINLTSTIMSNRSLKSAITFERTMYEGTAYFRFTRVGLDMETTFLTTVTNTFIMPTLGVHGILTTNGSTLTAYTHTTTTSLGSVTGDAMTHYQGPVRDEVWLEMKVEDVSTLRLPTGWELRAYPLRLEVCVS